MNICGVLNYRLQEVDMILNHTISKLEGSGKFVPYCACYRGFEAGLA